MQFSQIAELFKSVSAQMKCSVSQTTQQTFMFNNCFFLQMQNEMIVANSKQYYQIAQTMVCDHLVVKSDQQRPKAVYCLA